MNNSKPLSAWSWNDIHLLYFVYSQMFLELNEIHKRVNFPKPSFDFEDAVNSYLMRFWREVTRIDQQLEVLDIEIARRKKLVGVV